MIRPLKPKELKRLAERVEKAARQIRATNVEIYGSSPEDGIGATVVFDSKYGDRCALAFDPSGARKVTIPEIMIAMTQAMEGTRRAFENDPALSGVNPIADFSKLKRYILRWVDPPFVSDAFQPSADRIPPEQWEMMLNGLKIKVRQTITEYVASQSVIDYANLAMFTMKVNTSLDPIKFAAIARVDHFRILRQEELVLFLSMSFATREEVDAEVARLTGAGSALE